MLVPSAWLSPGGTTLASSQINARASANTRTSPRFIGERLTRYSTVSEMASPSPHTACCMVLSSNQVLPKPTRCMAADSRPSRVNRWRICCSVGAEDNITNPGSLAGSASR